MNNRKINNQQKNINNSKKWIEICLKEVINIDSKEDKRNLISNNKIKKFKKMDWNKLNNRISKIKLDNKKFKNFSLAKHVTIK